MINNTDGNFKVFGCDTDSIIFSKRDGSEISEQEQQSILDKVNSLFPDKIKFEDDGYYPSVIVFKAKNYVLFDGKEKKIKGSALKDQKKEPAIKEFQSAIIESILAGRNDYAEIYYSFVREAMDVKDMSRWSSKKSLTQKVFSSPRTNEKKVRDAIEGTDYREGDKVYVYFKSDESLGLVENFDGEYHKTKLLAKLHQSTKLFKSVLPTQEIFLNYALKKNKNILENICKL
jgi:hypothetical protein